MSNSSGKHNSPLPDSHGSDSEGKFNDSADTTTAQNAGGDDRLKDSGAGSVASASPRTCCANCQTVFEVSPELLASEDTRVRCGECLSIFDALINLRHDDDDENNVLVDEKGHVIDIDDANRSTFSRAGDQSKARSDELSASVNAGIHGAAGDHAQADSSALDVTYSDYDLFSGEAGLPDVAYFDQTQDLDSLRFDEPDGDETFSDTLFAHDMTIESPQLSSAAGKSPALEPTALDKKVDFVTDGVQSDPVVFRYRDPDTEPLEKKPVDEVGDLSMPPARPPGVDDVSFTQKHGHSRIWAVRVLLGVLILVIVSGLYGYRNRDALVQNLQLRPWLAKGCNVIGCTLAPLVDLSALKQLKRTVFAHPTNKNALVIDVAFMNDAAFAQPYPVLQIRLTNRNGGLVVQNDVMPSEYLDDWQPQDLLAAGERIDLSLTFEDPGQTAEFAVLKFLRAP